MADWHGTARSNYFKVRDNENFGTFMQQLLSMTAEHNVGDNTWLVQASDYNNGGFNWTIYDEDYEPDDSVNAMDEFASHLQEGEVAIFFEIGSEKLSYITGNSIAIAWNGEITIINLSDIYDLVATKYNIIPNLAEY
jgi:hypothetical protein